jgi:hypothetical protein
MFYKLKPDDRRAAAALFVGNGYIVKPAKQKRINKDGKPTSSWDYGIDISGTGEEVETEDDE